jgi:phosphoesterase RecJ-like protein
VQTQGRVIWTTIPLEDRRAAGHESDSEGGLVSFLLGAEEADAAVVLAGREDGRVEVSLRAVPGFDVAQVALRLGGGGHALAAGCNIPGPLEEAEVRVLDVLRAEMAHQRQA